MQGTRYIIKGDDKNPWTRKTLFLLQIVAITIFVFLLLFFVIPDMLDGIPYREGSLIYLTYSIMPLIIILITIFDLKINLNSLIINTANKRIQVTTFKTNLYFLDIQEDQLFRQGIINY